MALWEFTTLKTSVVKELLLGKRATAKMQKEKKLSKSL